MTVAPRNATRRPAVSRAGHLTGEPTYDRGVSEEGELVLPFPAPLERLGVATEIRSTLIASSLQSLKARGHGDRYSELLPDEHRDTILHCIAGQWFPMAVGFAHYETCDRLALTMEQQREIGEDVSRRIHETFLSVMLQVAKGVGVTPWTVLSKGNQIFARMAKGGGTQVRKIGPKDATIEIAGLPLLDIPYFRNATQGIYQVAIGMFAKRAHVRLIANGSRDPGKLTTMHASWV